MIKPIKAPTIALTTAVIAQVIIVFLIALKSSAGACSIASTLAFNFCTFSFVVFICSTNLTIVFDISCMASTTFSSFSILCVFAFSLSSVFVSLCYMSANFSSFVKRLSVLIAFCSNSVILCSICTSIIPPHYFHIPIAIKSTIKVAVFVVTGLQINMFPQFDFVVSFIPSTKNEYAPVESAVTAGTAI